MIPAVQNAILYPLNEFWNSWKANNKNCLQTFVKEGDADAGKLTVAGYSSWWSSYQSQEYYSSQV